MEYGKGKVPLGIIFIPESYCIILGYDLANQTAYLDSILRWGLDWLIKVCPAAIEVRSFL